ncbi:MAG: nitrate reductase molybdenum cofactor assembly chaperone [Gemmatimonadaceae bacterium]|nr:nitrate reductase molybdenum cofactor assembly chaperone [Gemmatimonadaceae bacterium]
MYTDTELRSLIGAFAAVLEYPAGATLRAAADAEQALRESDTASAALLREFHDYAAALPPGRLEEIYTGTFDLDAACHPYVGYHLFGETYKRSAVLVELKSRYAAEGFAVPANELPDHLAIVLHFMAVTRDSALGEEIARDALMPVLDRMTGRAKSEGFDEDPEAPTEEKDSEKRTPFHGTLEALRSVLHAQYGAITVAEPSA